MEKQTLPLRNMRDQDFRDQDLTDRNLSGCDLTGSKFDGSTGRGLNVSGSLLTDTTWRGAEQIEMNAEGIRAEGTLDQSCLMAPGLRAPGARVDTWILTSAEVRRCCLDNSTIGVLVGGAADMTDGTAADCSVGSIEGANNRLPRGLA